MNKRKKGNGRNAAVLILKKRITIMKTMYANIKKALKAILADYMTAMEMYGEALNRSRGCACA